MTQVLERLGSAPTVAFRLGTLQTIPISGYFIGRLQLEIGPKSRRAVIFNGVHCAKSRPSPLEHGAYGPWAGSSRLAADQISLCKRKSIQTTSFWRTTCLYVLAD